MLFEESNATMFIEEMNNYPRLQLNELSFSLKMIPLKEDLSIPGYILDLQDLEYVSGIYEESLMDCKKKIAEANNLFNQVVIVSVPEYRIIENPDIINEIDQCIVCSKRSYFDNIIESFCETAYVTNDYDLFEDNIYSLLTEKYFENDNTYSDKIGNALMVGGSIPLFYGLYKQKPVFQDIAQAKGDPSKFSKDFFDNLAKAAHPSQAGMRLFYAGTLLKYGSKLPALYQYYKDQPRTKIAKIIAKLRNIYLKALNTSKRLVDAKKAGLLRRFCTRVAHVIDKLLLALQRATN